MKTFTEFQLAYENHLLSWASVYRWINTTSTVPGPSAEVVLAKPPLRETCWNLLKKKVNAIKFYERNSVRNFNFRNKKSLERRQRWSRPTTLLHPFVVAKLPIPSCGVKEWHTVYTSRIANFLRHFFATLCFIVLLPLHLRQDNCSAFLITFQLPIQINFRATLSIRFRW